MAQERVQNFLDRNAKYAETYVPLPPLSRLRAIAQSNPIGSIVILTCADPRVIPEHFLNFGQLGQYYSPYDLQFSGTKVYAFGSGLQLLKTNPEASVIRTAGGRSMDCMRSLQILDTVGKVGTVLVIHHTDCGGLTITEDEVRQRMQERNPEEAKKVPASQEFGTFKDIGLDESIRIDVEFIKKAPFLGNDVLVLGYALDMETGLLRKVA